MPPYIMIILGAIIQTIVYTTDHKNWWFMWDFHVGKNRQFSFLSLLKHQKGNKIHKNLMYSISAIRPGPENLRAKNKIK